MHWSEKLAVLTCGKFGKSCICKRRRKFLVEVHHVEAHHAEQDKKEMSHFEKFVTDGNEKADELAKAGAMLDGGFMAQTRSKTFQQEREGVYEALQYAAWWRDGKTVKTKEKWTFVDKKRKETRHRTEWCAAASKYRCLRCGRGSGYMKMHGQCTGPKYLSKNWENTESDIWEDTIW